MIETLISSKTRIKLLLKFFLNSDMTAYLRNLEQEFGDSTNAIRVELNRFEQAGMLTSRVDGNKKVFQANRKHPLFQEVHNIIFKYVGLDQLLEYIVSGLGNLERVYLTGKFARGLNSDIIDLIFVGEIDQVYLVTLIGKAEEMVKRKIRYVIYSSEEFKDNPSFQENKELLLIWQS